jgi:hypothetical protein
MKQFLSGLILAVFAALPAKAAVMQAVYVGKVVSGTDLTNVFGAPVSQLIGTSFTASFVFDTTIGQSEPPGTVGQDLIQGGTFLGAVPSPVLSSSVTINGVTRTSAGTTIGYFDVWSAFPTYGSLISHAAIDRYTLADGTQINYGIRLFTYGPSLGLTPDLTQPLALTGLSALNGTPLSQTLGVITMFTCPPASVSCTDLSQLFVVPDTLTVTQVDLLAPVPLPASALMLLAGLGGLRAVRRRAAPVRAA